MKNMSKSEIKNGFKRTKKILKIYNKIVNFYRIGNNSLSKQDFLKMNEEIIND